MTRGSILALIGLVTTAVPSFAENKITSYTPQTIAAALILESYTNVTVTTDSSGDPFISGSSPNVPFTVSFYGCTDHQNCPRIQFQASLAITPTVTPEKMNAWNAGFVWPAKIYINANGSPTIECEFEMEPGGGMSLDTFGSNFAACINAAEHAAIYFK